MDLKYTLMHHDIEVAELTFDEIYLNISSITDVYNYEHLPFGTFNKGIIDKKRLNDWITGRSIPASRVGLSDALEKLNVQSSKELIFKSLGLSLSDHYWIKPFGANIKWKDVNFFENDFSEDIGKILCGYAAPKTIDFFTPDNTSDGWLRKRWKITDGKRVLIKGGSKPYRQEPFNEVIASKICDLLDIQHVEYSYIWQDDKPYSVCEDFITNNTELIPAYRLTFLRKKSNNDNDYQHFIKCCGDLQLDAVPFLDKVLSLDYIIANEDRHYNNFGIVRNPKSLDIIDFAPVYDSGTSLSYNKRLINLRDYDSKPFKEKPEEQLRLVSSLDWFDATRLNDISAFIKETLYPAVYCNLISPERPSQLAAAVEDRIEHIERLAHNRTRQQEQPLRNDLIEQQKQCGGYTPPATPVKQEQPAPEQTQKLIPPKKSGQGFGGLKR